MEALKFIKEFKKMKPYDTFNIKPDAYDMKTTGAPEDDKGEKKKGKKEGGGEAKTTGKKSGFGGKGGDDSDDADAAFTRKAQRAQDESGGGMGSAIESITNELGAKMPSFTRTAEAEISARKEIEQLMQVLS